MQSRINRTAPRPIRMKSRERSAPRPKPREVYPVRVRSHNGYVECQSSLLAEISGASLPKPSRPLHLKLEFGGGFLGKNRSVNCGLPLSPEATEVNGVLLGRREDSRVLILAFRQMAPAPDGRGFPPRSEEWERAFGGLVARVRWDPKLAGLQPVGWFRAHPEASMTLARRDLEIFNRFFFEPWHFGVVLQPADGTARGRFFLREADQSLAPDNFQDVVVRWNSAPSVVAMGPSIRPGAPSPSPATGRGQRRTRVAVWPALALLAAVLGVGAWWTLRPQKPAAVPDRDQTAAAPAIDQQAARQAAALWKNWENEARHEQVDAPPPPAEPAEPAKPVEEEIHRQPAAVPPRPADRGRLAGVEDRLAAIRRLVRSSSTAEARSVPPPERKSEAPPAQPAPKPSPAALLAEAPSLSTPSRSIQEPPAMLRASPVPPQAASQPSAPPPTPARAPQPLPATASPHPEPSVPRSGSGAPKLQPANGVSVPATPSSGRLIWTGRLRKNETIVFEGGKTSIGSSTGALPGRPIRFDVSPGNLTNGGMVVYTARLHGAGAAQEPPGPQNGWNKTVYEWDPARTADLEVMEAPSETNGWKRLVLRARSSKDSIIIVEWKAQP